MTDKRLSSSLVSWGRVLLLRDTLNHQVVITN